MIEIGEPEGQSFYRSFEDIEKLQDHGINVADIKKLKEAGMYAYQLS